jgi:hypothetical protein
MQRRSLFVFLMIIISLMAIAQPLLTIAQDSNTSGGFVTNTPLPNQQSSEADNDPDTDNATPSPLATQSYTPTPAPTAQGQQPDAYEDTVQVYLPEACEYVPGQTASDECREIIEANPKPDVEEIPPDNYTLNQYSFWRVGPQPVNTYDAPGGAVNGQIPQGFNFVNVVNQNDNWIQSETGAWIAKSDAYNVVPSRFTGVRLPDGWNQPFGWILDTTGIYASSVPGGPPDSSTGLVPRHYERFNIFAEAVDDEGWTWYMVEPDRWVKQIYMTVIQPTPKPESVSGRWVAIDLFEQSLVAYEDDTPRFATLISTGLPGTETNEGLFTVWARLARDGMSGATGAPNAYALQSVPWVLYFDDSISLHGTYWHDFFGYRRSRGCVNLSISDARWVFEWLADANAPVDENGELVNYVYVHSTGEYR